LASFPDKALSAKKTETIVHLQRKFEVKNSLPIHFWSPVIAIKATASGQRLQEKWHASQASGKMQGIRSFRSKHQKNRSSSDDEPPFPNRWPPEFGMGWRRKMFRKGWLWPGEALNMSTGSDSRAVDPPVRCDPASVSVRRSSAELGGNGLAALGTEKLLGLLQSQNQPLNLNLNLSGTECRGGAGSYWQKADS
jgi:hypothetical protein